MAAYRALVGVTRCGDPNDFETVLEATGEVLDLIGGIRSIVSAGDIVLIKPNVGFKKNHLTGATTNINVVKALSTIIKGVGARKIIIAEGAIVGTSTRDTFQANGYYDIAGELGVELLDLKTAEMVAVPVPCGKAFHRLHVPRAILEADVVVNVPVMKTHDALPVTLGLKNMKGIIREQDKKRFHKWGLSQAIVDLNKVAYPDLTVLDGTIGMEGLGPAHGEPANLGVMLASTDTVAADAIGSLVMGIDPGEVEYIGLADAQGLGCGDPDEINVAGVPVSEVARKVKRHTLDFSDLIAKDIHVYESGSCSGCRHFMETFISNLERTGELGLLVGNTIVFGQTASMPQRGEIRGKLILVGRCVKDVAAAARSGQPAPEVIYIPGCPPHGQDVKAMLKPR
ncbi:MAG TPA: DUF362 domain-containing protein [Firmicutes bacterium]|nr:DUF362 domain-containing protein [Bacillota bacterium]